MFTLFTACTFPFRSCPITRLPGAAIVAATSLALLAPATPAFARQSPARSADDEALYIGAITGDSVYVRCGSAESYYPFFKVNRGDIVKVTKEQFGWARVAVVGPAFRDAFGYIKHARGDNSRFRISSDGAAGTTLGRVDVLAPNLDASNQPKDSWKTLVRLDADQTVRVLETRDDGLDVVHKVALPASATGWISSQFVPRASAEEAEMFRTMLENERQSAQAFGNAPRRGSTPPQQPANANPGAARPASGNAPPSNSATAAAPPSSSAAPIAAPPVSESEPLVSPIGATDDALASGADPNQPNAAPASVPQPKPRDPTLEDLEKTFAQMKQDIDSKRIPLENAEVLPMRELYVALAGRHPNDRRISRFAETRARQLKIWADVQATRQELAAAQARMKMSAEEAEAVRAALERSAEYTAVGRIAASTIYDGTSLPKLFRVQDSATGRTIAYLKPDEDYTLANRLDIIVGIVGDKTYDESLRLNIITPRRIDVLTPDKSPAAAPSGVAGASTDTEDK